MAVEGHLCWRKERHSLFISVFGNKRHAENWALDWSERHGDKICQVSEIKASELVGGYMFSADEIQENLCLQVPEKAEASIRDEYLIGYRIPAQAIAGCRNIDLSMTDVGRSQCGYSAQAVLIRKSVTATFAAKRTK